MSRYPDEVAKFIQENAKGISASDLTERLNNKFGTEYEVNQIRAYKKNHKIRSGVSGGVPKGTSKTYPPKVRKFIEDHIQGRELHELVESINDKFDTEYTYSQIRAYCKNNGLKNGVNTRIKPGNIPPNKGKKGIRTPGSEKGWFKKGGKPHNTVPIGTEVVRPSNGYVWVKIKEPNIWRMKHLVEWEKVHGKLPSGKMLLFLDGNKENTDLSNLKMVDRAINIIMNNKGFRTVSAEYTEVGVNVAKLMNTVSKKRRKKP